MDWNTTRAATLGRAILYEIRAERITFMAGSIAYHAFVSLLPLLLLLLTVVATLGNQDLEQGLIALTQATLTPGAGEALVEELRNASTSAGVSLLGGAVLVWGTLRIFRGLDTAFSDIYESEAANTFFDQIRDGVVVLVSVALAILVAALLESALPPSDGSLLNWSLGRLVLVFGLVLAFFPMYYVFPDQDDMRAREVLPGVLFAAVGLAAFESVFRLYIEYSSRQPTQSVLAGILVFLTWLYFSGLVILVGAAINAVTSNRSRDVDVRPLFDGVPKGTHGARTADRASYDRDALVDAVDRLREALQTAESVVVHVDDVEVSLPPPDSVQTDAESSSLPFLNRAVGVEFRWSPPRRRE